MLYVCSLSLVASFICFDSVDKRCLVEVHYRICLSIGHRPRQMMQTQI